ncbi:flavodoxin family protein [Bacillus sp. FJAT-42376]|uniref:flavodoxin family protein n=1 Tax=Bacillus sp. FJAT-42376 TaxID=2014076 RepID=UPI000F4FAEBA|nr:flavodoxin family protein [Bacillus sp. FJAT-42376]AZB40978.1 flavodoxin family protein [Bacillus sp. FJAT-42376]
MTVKALVLNCSLKKGEEESNTEALIKKVTGIMQREGVYTEIVRVADYNVSFGISDDMGGGDEWPEIFEKIKEADIVIIGTPLWLGEKSSIATMVMERIYGGSSLTNEKGQSIYYNKVGGAVITGNEDGAKDAAKSILYGLAHMGFTIPPNTDTYWVGEAGPGPSFIEAEGYKNEFTKQHVQMLAYNLIHFARLLKENPIPAQGTVIQ